MSEGKVVQSVQVCVRTRPTSKFAHECLGIEPDRDAINVHLAKSNDHINNQQEDWSFKFDKVLHNADQEEVYDFCGRDIVDSVLQGYNGTLLAYGQTGAGKTFTMCGANTAYKYRGVIPRALSHIFQDINNRPESAVIVRISYLEIYNEQFFDLLTDPSSRAEIAVRDDAYGKCVVKGLTRVVCENEEDALNLLFMGETNRSIAEHQMNKNSTRSHCIFTIALESRSRVESSEKVVRSKLNLVDLAGSERVGKTGSTGETLAEAKYINKSLSFLEQVVVALGNRNRDHIPFRQSKLTNVLRDSLGGNCKTRMIANIWAEKQHMEETISTLKFATRMMRISNEATINITLDPVQLVQKYERVIKELKQELAMHDTLANRGAISYEEYTPEQQHEIQGLVQSYVKGDIAQIEVVNLRQINEIFKQFKTLVLNKQAQLDDVMANPAAALQGISGSPTAGDCKANDGISNLSSGGVKYVGEMDATASGFHLGQAPTHASPIGGVVARLPPSPSKREVKQRGISPNDGSGDEATQFKEKRVPQTEAEGFEMYKEGDGAEHNETLLVNKKALKAKRAELRGLTKKVNECKSEIDRYNYAIKECRRPDQGNASDGPQVIDEDEYLLIQQCSQAKQRYSKFYHERKMLQNEVAYLKGLVEQSKVNLANQFIAWYESNFGPIKSVAIPQKTLVAGSPNEDILDDGEQFDRLEKERVMQEDPNSISFYNARKHIEKTTKRRGKPRRDKTAGSRRWA